MNEMVIDFREIDSSKWMLVGGKGANLGELCHIEGIAVPEGFCISTEAYREVTKGNRELQQLLGELSGVDSKNLSAIGQISANIRKLIEGMPITDALAAAVEAQLLKLGPKEAYAVRSSATAEDLPTASFAGQQDTYLNVIGRDAILQHTRKCWASLFTERAVVYRQQNGFDHRKILLSVVVQRMVFPQVSGILFTADPVSANRKVLCIDAGFGLGEALVSGWVNADHYKVRAGKLIGHKIATKKLGIYALKAGGTASRQVAPSQQGKPALSESQILQLEQLGRQIERHFGQPQDVEWCLADGIFYMVQSRPITTLFPIPEAADDENRVYVSVGHNQMMTDAMKPLGLSFFKGPFMLEAGGRLFVDVTAQLSSPEGSKRLIETFGQSDQLVTDAIKTVVARKFVKPSGKPTLQQGGYIEKKLTWRYLAKFESDPTIVEELIRRNENSIAELKRQIQTQSGAALFDFIAADKVQMRQLLSDPQSWELIKVGLYALGWINQKMWKWLGERGAADVLSQSVQHNVTSAMGLALLEVADAIRPYPALIRYLKQTKADDFLDGLDQFDGGMHVREAIGTFLDNYGMRCAGEIDITKTRWSERPLMLVPLLLSHIKNFEPHAAQLKFEQGRKEALQKEEELLARLKLLPNGQRKARETQRMIGLLRNLIGYREYPKYGMICRYWIYKQALMKEATKLVHAKVIRQQEDVYYLSFEEFKTLVQSHRLDGQLIEQRKEAHLLNEQLQPPRVLTSEGEAIWGSYKRRNIPNGAIMGLPVSAGIVEGRARVILDMATADLESGDILVTAFTDPSWTPLFVAIKGLVTEIGGIMTHGAVIAREYGLPAVVGVEQATTLIKDGQQIRVNGTAGYVEIL